MFTTLHVGDAAILLRECQTTHDMKIVCKPCVSISFLSPFLFVPPNHASFLKFVGFFIYLSPLIFIYTQCISLSGGKAPIKIPIVFSVSGDDAVWSA